MEWSPLSKTASETEMLAAADKQLSLNDPDARSMRTRGTGMVGYNVQRAVDTEQYLIVAHEITNEGSDRRMLSMMAIKARTETDVENLEVVADRGYYGDYKSQEIKFCDDEGIMVYIPKTHTSNN